MLTYNLRIKHSSVGMTPQIHVKRKETPESKDSNVKQCQYPGLKVGESTENYRGKRNS